MNPFHRKSRLETIMASQYPAIFNEGAKRIREFTRELKGQTRSEIASELQKFMLASSGEPSSVRTFCAIALFAANLKDLPENLFGRILSANNGQPGLLDLTRVGWQEMTENEIEAIYLMLTEQQAPDNDKFQLAFWRLTLELSCFLGDDRALPLQERWPMSEVGPGLSFEQFMANSDISEDWKMETDKRIRQQLFENYNRLIEPYCLTVFKLAVRQAYGRQLLEEQAQFLLYYMDQSGFPITVEDVAAITAGLTPPYGQPDPWNKIRYLLLDSFMNLPQANQPIANKSQLKAWTILSGSNQNRHWTKIGELLANVPKILKDM